MNKMRNFFVAAATPVLLTCASAALFPTSAFGQNGDVAVAAKAFARAEHAELTGNHSRAAELYELADRVAPTPQALRAATRARFAASQLSAAAGNAEALKRRYPKDLASVKLAEVVLSEALKTLARVAVTCEAPCDLLVDQLAVSTAVREEHVVYVKPGAHRLVATYGAERSEPRSIEVVAGEELTLAVARPAPKPAVAAPPAKAGRAPLELGGLRANPAATRALGVGPAADAGLSPVIFYSVLGATVAAGAAATWSGLDLVSAKNDFEANPTQAGFNEGDSKDMRTTVLLVATGGLAAATTVLGFFTDWTPDGDLEASAAVTHEGGQIQVKGRF